jgi:predicted nucleic acid-binding protein
MTALVLDASVTICWCFPDQRTDYSKAVLSSVTEGLAVVPALWAIEVGNVLLTSTRRGVLSPDLMRAFLENLADYQDPDRVLGDVLRLAQKHRLTNYDACYLELAKRMSLPLASQDSALLTAAQREGVMQFGHA